VFSADDSAIAPRQPTRVMDQRGVGHEIAENGKAALDAQWAHAAQGPVTGRFAMLLSDIEMPEVDGCTLAKTMKAGPALRGLYVCLHTSLSGSVKQSMAGTVGADRLVPKFDPDELAALVISSVNGGPDLPAWAPGDPDVFILPSWACPRPAAAADCGGKRSTSGKALPSSAPQGLPPAGCRLAA
jgi:CheY-like chemotaxis protein